MSVHFPTFDRTISDLGRSVVAGEEELRVYSRGKRDDVYGHIEMIRREFIGKSELALHHAVVIVLIRRKIDLEENCDRFSVIWREAPADMCSMLDSRWLVSACDTIADHWPEPAERALAIAASLFVNTIKLYETERLAGGAELRNQKYELPPGRVALHDGMSAFRIGSGDMVRNMFTRAGKAARDSTISGRILKELIARACRHDTVLRRFADVHLKESTRW